MKRKEKSSTARLLTRPRQHGNTTLPRIQPILTDRPRNLLPHAPSLSAITNTTRRNRPLAPPIHRVGIPRDARIVTTRQRVPTTPDVDGTLLQPLLGRLDVGMVPDVVPLELLLAVDDAGRVRRTLEDEPAQRAAPRAPRALDPLPALAQPPLVQGVLAAVVAELLPRHAAEQTCLRGQEGCVPTVGGFDVVRVGGFGLLVGQGRGWDGVVLAFEWDLAPGWLCRQRYVW